LHYAERDLAEEMADQMSDEWLIIGNVSIAEDLRPPKEIDLVLVHPRAGVHCVEVKASKVEIRSGTWRQLDRRSQSWHDLSPSPVRQVDDGAYRLRRRLRDAHDILSHITVSSSIALVDIVELCGDQPLDVQRERLLLAGDIETSIEDAIERAIDISGQRYRLDDAALQVLMALLLPDLAMTFDPRARHTRQRHRIEASSLDQVRGLSSLDMNRRVVVFGSAGTGKTRLAHLWARQGCERSQRVWLTCYNDPLADYLRQTTAGRHAPYVRSFLRHIQSLPDVEIPPEPVDPAAQHEYWNSVLPERVFAQVSDSYGTWDRIVVDEFQDFTDLWVDILERLLTPNGALLCVADRAQDVYGRALDWTRIEGVWTVAELRRNCRNTRAIARLLRALGGAIPAPSTSEGEEPIFLCDQAAEATPANVLSHLLGVLEPFRPEETLIVTRTRADRDDFRALALNGRRVSNWESRDDSTFPCETTRRAKGLEAPHVVVYDPAGRMARDELYVAISRAQHRLTMVCPARVRDDLKGSAA
jgi:hypothetical protein